MAKKKPISLSGCATAPAAGFRKLSGAVGKVAQAAGAVDGRAHRRSAAITGGLFLRGAIRSAGQFDEAMSRVGAVTGATAGELDKLRTAADEASARTRFTAEQAANGLEELSAPDSRQAKASRSLNPVLDLAPATISRSLNRPSRSLRR